MNITKVISSLDFSLSVESLRYINLKARQVTKALKVQCKKEGIAADVFVGGSLAKNTMMASPINDVDIFVRFHDNPSSDSLEPLIRTIAQQNSWTYARVHGSRDYFSLQIDKSLVMEIIPVKKIRAPTLAENVTDLSYFHVRYLKPKISNKLAKEIVFAKAFCKAQGVYGAESYIGGISGYGIECLLLHYKSFLNMVKSIAKLNPPFVIDPAKHFPRAQEVFVHLNESKLTSPIILVDPTWKERNVLAALTPNTFIKFQSACKKFIASPSHKFFTHQPLSIDYWKKQARAKKGEYIQVVIATDKQPGDIAGTKLRKFSEALMLQISKKFDIKNQTFTYTQDDRATLDLILIKKKILVVRGPPSNLKHHVSRFKKEHPKVFIRENNLYARMTLPFSAQDYLMQFIRAEKKMLSQMHITYMGIGEYFTQ